MLSPLICTKVLQVKPINYISAHIYAGKTKGKERGMFTKTGLKKIPL